MPNEKDKNLASELYKKRVAPSDLNSPVNEPSPKRSKSISLESENSRLKIQSFKNSAKPSESSSTASSVFKKRHFSASPSSSSSSLSSCIENVDFEAPCNSTNNKQLNNIDAEKKKYLNSHKLNSNSAAVSSNKPVPAYKEALKKLPCKERNILLGQQPQKKKGPSADLNLTQHMNLAKFENKARLEQALEEAKTSNQMNKTSNVNSSNTSIQNSNLNNRNVYNVSKPLIIPKNPEQPLAASKVILFFIPRVLSLN